jgi:hypothetical protein
MRESTMFVYDVAREIYLFLWMHGEVLENAPAVREFW